MPPFDATLARQMANAVRAGYDVPDGVFDRCLPEDLQIVSAQHWTPLEVAKRVAHWVDELGLRSVVDIGSGAGKFCVAAALSSRAKFIGVEQRENLVHAARGLAFACDVRRQVTFVHATLGQDLLPCGDAYYFFNPFGENLHCPEDRLDSNVELSIERYKRDVAAVEGLLADAPVGTYLILYNGFGGAVPSNYFELRVDREFYNVLRLLKKRAEN